LTTNIKTFKTIKGERSGAMLVAGTCRVWKALYRQPVLLVMAIAALDSADKALLVRLCAAVSPRALIDATDHGASARTAQHSTAQRSTPHHTTVVLRCCALRCAHRLLHTRVPHAPLDARARLPGWRLDWRLRAT